MSILDRLFSKKPKNRAPADPEKKQTSQKNPEQDTAGQQEMPEQKQSPDPGPEKEETFLQTTGAPTRINRSIRIFVSSTFRDMTEDRNELMTHCWPQLRRFCAERHIELTEVDLRWGISEEQSTRKETLKLCLDEIRACRPFFIGLLGQRYGWVPGDDAFTADLKEEQPWLKDLPGKSVTELEILHGVLNNPEMAERAFFYFRDPAYAMKKGGDFLPENEAYGEKQDNLKALIRETCSRKNIPIYENYANPQELSTLVLKRLKTVIELQFPIRDLPDPLDRESSKHEAFAEIRRRTYIGRSDYYDRLDSHCNSEGKPLLLLGDSGSGKSALLANWLTLWQKKHPDDFIFQHYIGGTPDSSNHWEMITRLIKEIRRWSEDTGELPRSKDDILRDFPVWLSKARIKAERTGIRFVIILDALNQLDDTDHARLLGWLPEHPFTGALRLIVSTLPGETLDTIEKRNWQTLDIQPLSMDERLRMIVDYLKKYSKKLDDSRLHRISGSPQTSNPLFLKILLDELRVTGTHEKLDERLNDYLAASDIAALLQKVLNRYQEDYERDRPGLVGDALGLIWAARRGLAESELLQLLRSGHQPQLPLATWAPLRAALEEGLVDMGGIMNFAHDFLRSAIERAFFPNLDKQDDFRIALADFFEAQPPTVRSCDELPWLLLQNNLLDRLRNCLLKIDYFNILFNHNKDELRQYWAKIDNKGSIGKSYLESFEYWIKTSQKNESIKQQVSNDIASFLAFEIFQPEEAEVLFNKSLEIAERELGSDHPEIAKIQNKLGKLFQATNRLKAAGLMFSTSLNILINHYGNNHFEIADTLYNYSRFLQITDNPQEAKSMMERLLKIDIDKYGNEHPIIARDLDNLSGLYHSLKQFEEAEPLAERALKIEESFFGKDHPNIAVRLNNYAQLLVETGRAIQAESLMHQALMIIQKQLGMNHPNVAIQLNNIGMLLLKNGQYAEAESFFQQATEIDEKNYGPSHPNVARDLNNMAMLMNLTNRLQNAELIMERALKIEEQSFGNYHHSVAISLNNLGMIKQSLHKYQEAEPLLLRAFLIFKTKLGIQHPNTQIIQDNYTNVLYALGWEKNRIFQHIIDLSTRNNV